jgi:hypothetical protein
MIRDGLLVFRNMERLLPVLPAVLAGAGLGLERGTVRLTVDGIAARAAPAPLSWWGDEIQIRLHPDEGGTTVVEFVSRHNGFAGFMDVENVARLRRSFKRTMKSLRVTVGWVRPRLN